MGPSLVWFFSYAFTSLAWYALIASLCFVLYRSLKLPGLPWIAVRYGLAFCAWILSGYAIRRIFPPGSFETRPPLPSAHWHLPPGAWIGLSEMLAAAVSDLLTAMLAFSEVAFLVARAFPDVQSGLLAFLLRARQHVFALGVGACALTVTVPMFELIFLWLHGPFTPKA